MKGKTWLFWGGLIAAAGGVLFQTSYDVQDLEEKLAGLNRKIVTEQESIQVLKAEWSYLNDPTKLEEMARAHLALQPVEARQFLALDVIPMRPAPAPDAPVQPLPGRGLTPAPLPPMVAAPAAPQIASARVPAPKTPAPIEQALEKAPVVIPAALSSPRPAAAPARTAPIKPSTLVPASARAPALPPASAPLPPAQPSAAPGKLAPNQPLPSLNRPTDVASRPLPAPAPKAAAPAQARAAAPQPYTPKPTDSLGLLVARLGANQ
ncbi:hypothetical protein J2847_002393 [Azospirillum agricola]|uniref:cell division protein FtsL n=1 Tax=Azospirillum agricola TaxID=1720247 RepID=UPI001AE8D052|nr:hypothetical protein [Azospirillum agricola]MBP2229099.1 hypothetical protein [Azospirillum agricola]